MALGGTGVVEAKAGAGLQGSSAASLESGRNEVQRERAEQTSSNIGGEIARVEGDPNIVGVV